MWPMHPQPRSDEILSSWMVRLAHANGAKVHSFYALEFGRDRQIWNRDIDRMAPDWLLKGLAERTRIDSSHIYQMSLRAYESILYERHNDSGNTRWILPLGIFHRTRRRRGMQYCPLCLASDEVPYFRKHWRLAFYTECDLHGVMLRDACPNCESPIVFHRAELGKRNLIHPLSIVHCFQCGQHLATAPNGYHLWTDWEHQITFRTLLTFHSMGWMGFQNLQFQFSHLLFDGLYQLCRLVSHQNSDEECFLLKLEEVAGYGKRSPLSKTQSFEARNIQERHRIFAMAIWLLMQWPERFIGVTEKLNATSSLILKDMQQAPFWFESVIKDRRYFPNPISFRGKRS